MARECRFLWALVGNLQPRGVALPLRADQDSLIVFLTMFLWVLIVSVFGGQLLHVDLLRFVPHDEHLGELVLGPNLLASDLTSLSAKLSRE